MLAANLATILFAAALTPSGFHLHQTPIAQSLFSIGAAFLFLPGLVALWFVKSRRANLLLLLALNALLLVGALGPVL